MAYQSEAREFSLPAAADLRASSYRLVVMNSSGQIALCGAGARPHGTIDQGNNALEQQRFWMRPGAIRKCKVGVANIAAGAKLASDATGRLVTAASGNAIVGLAFAAMTAGDVASFFYDPSLGLLP